MIRPGDIFEDCAYHPVLCLEVHEDESISGVSLIDGSGPRNCSLRHCGVIRLTPYDVQQIRRDFATYKAKRQRDWHPPREVAGVAAEISAEGLPLIGLTEAEIAEVAADQQVARLPSSYRDFLRLMGRGTGRLLVGTDAFYPQLLGLKCDAAALLEADGQASLVPAAAVVVAMHQGYQVYWMQDLGVEDPPVYMFQEGTRAVAGAWASFTEFLRSSGMS